MSPKRSQKQKNAWKAFKDRRLYTHYTNETNQEELDFVVLEEQRIREDNQIIDCKTCMKTYCECGIDSTQEE